RLLSSLLPYTTLFRSLLGQELVAYEVLGSARLELILIDLLTGHLRLHRHLLKLALVGLFELFLIDLLAVDLGDDVRDPLEVGLGQFRLLWVLPVLFRHLLFRALIRAGLLVSPAPLIAAGSGSKEGEREGCAQ